jgi:hypothetical protein
MRPGPTFKLGCVHASLARRRAKPRAPNLGAFIYRAPARYEYLIAIVSLETIFGLEWTRRHDRIA